MRPEDSEESQGIENVESLQTKANCQKMIMNGKLLILHNGHYYNVLGTQMNKK